MSGNLLTTAHGIGLSPSPVYFLTLLLVLSGTITPQNDLSSNSGFRVCFSGTPPERAGRWPHGAEPEGTRMTPGWEGWVQLPSRTASREASPPSGRFYREQEGLL